jgi:HK97 family phage major capsid protein
MLTREQYEALVGRMRAGETLTRAELDSMRAYQRAEAGTLSTRLAGADATADDATRVDALAAEVADTESRIAAMQSAPAALDGDRARAARERIASLVNAGVPGSGGGTGQPVDESQRGTDTDGSGQQRQRPLTIAQRFTESEQLRAFAERNFVGQVAVDLPDVDARALINQRTTIDSTGVGFNGSRNPYVGIIDTTPDRALRLAELIDRQTTQLNSVPYLIEAANTGVAAEVAEGAAKPEATYTFTEAEAPVRTIAHWVPITRQAAEDNATLMGYINGRLSYGLELRLDAQILNGNGTAPNLRGIVNTSGVGAYTPGAAEARIITIRKAITVAQLSEYQPDTVVLHPTDWQGIELDTDNNGQFRVTASVQNALTPRLWGLNVVVTTAITVATYLVGAFRLGATLWERHGIRLLMSDSHGTNFTANILVLLAEMRAALTVWRPAAFVKGGFV